MKCPECKGEGGDYKQDGEGEVKRDVCPKCEGTGEVAAGPWPDPVDAFQDLLRGMNKEAVNQ